MTRVSIINIKQRTRSNFPCGRKLGLILSPSFCIFAPILRVQKIKAKWFCIKKKQKKERKKFPPEQVQKSKQKLPDEIIIDVKTLYLRNIRIFDCITSNLNCTNKKSWRTNFSLLLYSLPECKKIKIKKSFLGQAKTREPFYSYSLWFDAENKMNSKSPFSLIVRLRSIQFQIRIFQIFSFSLSLSLSLDTFTLLCLHNCCLLSKGIAIYT